MAPRAANITSIDAVRGLKVALQQFAADAHDAFILLELEGRRPIEWIEHDRSRYWPQEVRKASDALSEARSALARCRLTTVAGGDPRSCYDEQQALEAAKRRFRLAEKKVEVVRYWRVKIRQEVDEFQVHLAKLQRYLDGDLLRAIAVLERMAVALDEYVEGGASSQNDGVGQMWAAARAIMDASAAELAANESGGGNGKPEEPTP